MVGGTASRKVLKRFPLDWTTCNKDMYDIVIKDFDKTRAFIAADIFNVDIYFELYKAKLPDEKLADFIKYSNRWKLALIPYRKQRLVGAVLAKEVKKGVLGTKQYNRGQNRRTPSGGLIGRGTTYFYFIGHFKPFPKHSHLAKIQRQESLIKASSKRRKMLYSIYGFENVAQCRNCIGIISEKTGRQTRCQNRFESAPNKKFCDDCNKLRRKVQNKKYKRKRAADKRRLERSRKRHHKLYVHKTITGWARANQKLAKEDPEEFFNLLMNKITKGELR